MTERTPAEELRELTQMVRSYVEWQVECGATGAPRGANPEVPRETADVGVPADVGAPATGVIADGTVRATADVGVPATFETRRDVSLEVGAREAPEVAAPEVGPVRSLEILRDKVASCTQCDLAKERTQTVFSRGNPMAKLAFVGEAPGADEDAQGAPFVGRAGQLLDKMIAAMGLDPERDVYVCNIIKCRPPDNRKPTPQETETCIPYLHEQLKLVSPRVIVAMGNTAVQALLGTSAGITKVRGSWKLYKGKTPMMPTYHPSYLLRASPQQTDAKREAWEDLQEVMRELGLPAPGRKKS